MRVKRARLTRWCGTRAKRRLPSAVDCSSATATRSSRRSARATSRTTPTRFLIDPKDHIAGAPDARQRGLDVVGFYHSHPTVARAAIGDRSRRSGLSGSSLLHRQPRGLEPDVRLFRLDAGNFLRCAVRHSRLKCPARRCSWSECGCRVIDARARSAAQRLCPPRRPFARSHHRQQGILRRPSRCAFASGSASRSATHPSMSRERLERQYRDEGYAFARVKAEFDPASGVLTSTSTKASIDAVEFQGVDEQLARTFAEEFAMRAGDVFNSRRARQALDVLLQPTRGAVSARPHPFADVHRQRRCDDGGAAASISSIATASASWSSDCGSRQDASRCVPDLGEREDWFSSVDGFVPSLGMGIAVFDHERFNHAYRRRAPFVQDRVRACRVLRSGSSGRSSASTKVYVGGELHDLTASDDLWQVSSLEASLAAVGARRSYRDYYRRRGVQINAAVRIQPHVEALFAWRGERQEPLRDHERLQLLEQRRGIPPEYPRAGRPAQRARRRRVDRRPRLRS